jgi:hypothetical protein
MYNEFHMGYMTELNTLLKLPKNFPFETLAVGKTYEIIKEKERSFPLHIAILTVANDWTFLGYSVANEAVVKNHQTKLVFTVLSLFPKDQQKIYTNNFLTAAKITGEL